MLAHLIALTDLAPGSSLVCHYCGYVGHVTLLVHSFHPEVNMVMQKLRNLTCSIVILGFPAMCFGWKLVSAIKTPKRLQGTF